MILHNSAAALLASQGLSVTSDAPRPAAAVTVVPPPSATRPAGSPSSALPHVKLLVQLGLASWGDAGRAAPLVGGDTLRRQLRALDQLRVREPYKVGVVYMGPGQRSKDAMLANERGSAAFEQFLDGLGWPVDLAAHDGYSGLVRPDQFVAPRLPYYTDGAVEVLFHAAPRMGVIPTPADGQSEGT
jgi:hypothetical protein